ncbi:MAG: hypothetical protein HGA45_37895, partial [Chloroflexales bacterium]|nr:hypothetical protein [Chloroflexales bacterium]
ILEEAVPGAPSSPAPLTADAPDTSAPEADQRIAALEEELRAKEEYLRTTREEMETANEELQSVDRDQEGGVEVADLHRKCRKDRADRLVQAQQRVG